MNKFVKLLGLSALVLATAACSKVEAGNVGVIANLYGSDKGVQTEVVGPGRYWIGWNQDLYIFPTFTQTVNWARSEETGDQRFTFQDMDGLKIIAPVGITYSIDKSKAALLFQKYRRGIDEITNVFLRRLINDSFNIEASKLRVDTIYGPEKEAFIRRVQARVDAQVRKDGIIIDRIYWSGDMELPGSVMESLNAKIKANQITLQRDNEVKTAEAEAKIALAKAEGDAQATITRAEAQAKANQIIANSLTSTLVEYNKIQKWNGALPTVTGGATPMIDMRN